MHIVGFALVENESMFWISILEYCRWRLVLDQHSFIFKNLVILIIMTYILYKAASLWVYFILHRNTSQRGRKRKGLPIFKHKLFPFIYHIFTQGTLIIYYWTSIHKLTQVLQKSPCLVLSYQRFFKKENNWKICHRGTIFRL